MPIKTSLYKYPAILYAALIFILSANPSIAPPPGFVFEDKIYHFIEYGIFSFLLFLAFYHSRKEFLKKNFFLLSCIIGITYGLSDEIHQSFVPGRSCEFLDFVADCLGILLVQIGIWLYLKRRRKNLPVS
jgi:VanZ family protein